MTQFIGRQNEIHKLLELSRKKTASFIVVRGRRRIGKSRLIEEFSKYFDKFYSFQGLPPEEYVTAQNQLEEFSGRKIWKREAEDEIQRAKDGPSQHCERQYQQREKPKCEENLSIPKTESCSGYHKTLGFIHNFC